MTTRTSLNGRWLAIIAIGALDVLAACTGGPASSGHASGSAPASSPSSVAAAQTSPSPSPGGSASPAGDCGTGQAAFLAAATAEAPHSLNLGGTEIPFTTAMISMKDGSYDADDAIPAYVGLSTNLRTVEAAPADPIPLSGDSITFSLVNVSVFKWSEIDFTGGLAHPGSILRGAGGVQPDGSATIAAPNAPGEFGIEITANWVGRCLAGDGVGYGRIVVR